MNHIYFVPRAERQPLRYGGILDAMVVTRPEERRWLGNMYRRLREAGVCPADARAIMVHCLYIGRYAERVEFTSPDARAEQVTL